MKKTSMLEDVKLDYLQLKNIFKNMEWSKYLKIVESRWFSICLKLGWAGEIKTKKGEPTHEEKSLPKVRLGAKWKNEKRLAGS